eukprot:Gb_32809 [translate_table: standard]
MFCRLPYAKASVGEVTKKSLSWRADLIHRAIAEAANEEHFQSLVDWVEKQRPDGALAKIYCKADSHSVVVSSDYVLRYHRWTLGGERLRLLATIFRCEERRGM